MKKYIVVLTLVLLGSGCLLDPGPKVQPCEGENCTLIDPVDPVDKPALKGTFVSGHLGSYYDCPDQGYGGTQAPQGDFAEGACAEGETCAPILNCEGAQVLIRLTNGGDADGLGVSLQQVELINQLDEVVADLPIIAVTHTDREEQFDGVVGTADATDLRVEFQGPINAYELLSVEDAAGDRAFGAGGFIRLTFSADNHEDVVIMSTEIFDLPAVDT